MIECYSKGCVPKRLFARAKVNNGAITANYEVDWRRNTNSPLSRIDFDKGHCLEVRFTESWFHDIEARTLENADAVVSHGITRMNAECRYDINTATHHYVHPGDRECLAADHRYYRHLPTVKEILKPAKGIKLQAVTDRLLKSDDEQVALIFDVPVRIDIDGEVQLAVPAQHYGYSVAFGNLARKLSKTPDIRIKVEPDPEEAGTCLPAGEECDLKVVIESSDIDKGQEVEVSVYGALQGRKKIHIDSGGASIAFKGKPDAGGILPLLVMIEGEDFLITKVFEVLVLPTLLQSTDRRFNGVFIEQMRSILMRNFFNIVPEDDPRGSTGYALYFYPRNFTSYSLCAFGFSDLGFSHLEAYTEILKRDGFLAQDYYVNGSQWWDTPAALMHVNANDGIGFYLLQMAKCIFRYPEKKVDLAGVEQAIRWLAMHTHWNGLLDDHSEPVAQHHSERLAGSPYAQGLCMAGLKAIAKALKMIGENEIAENAEWLFRFQIDGFRKFYERFGFIRDIQRLADPDKQPCYSDYSMPCPSLVLLDPEVDVHDLDHLYERTLKEVINDNIRGDGNPWMLGKYEIAGGAYSHEGIMGSFLNLCRLEEAGRYLNETLKYSEDTRLRYILPEGVAYNEDFYRAHLPELKARAPWVYKDIEEKDPDLPGGSSNPGCLVKLSYWLYCADLICGISVDGKELKIWPKIPGYMEQFSVKNYHTRYSKVSYQYTKENGRITLHVHKDAVETVVVLGPLPAVRVVTVGGKKVDFEEVKMGDGSFARLQLPEGEGSYMVEITQ